MPRTTKKPLKSVIAETLSSMTPKKAKKPENVIKYYCIIEYTHIWVSIQKDKECEQMDPLWTNSRPHLSFWVSTCIFHSSSFVKYCANNKSCQHTILQFFESLN